MLIEDVVSRQKLLVIREHHSPVVEHEQAVAEGVCRLRCLGSVRQSPSAGPAFPSEAAIEFLAGVYLDARLESLGSSSRSRG